MLKLNASKRQKIFDVLFNLNDKFSVESKFRLWKVQNQRNKNAESLLKIVDEKTSYHMKEIGFNALKENQDLLNVINYF